MVWFSFLFFFNSIHSYWTPPFQLIHLSLKTVMGKLKHSRVGPRKPSLPTSRTLIFTLFVTFIFLILFLILLSLRIPKPKHLNSITHINTLRFFFNSTTNIYIFLFALFSLFMTSLSCLFYACRRDDDDNKRWVEIVSWEPRAFLYHNFLVSSFPFFYF